jgi:HD-GYP domain-containing protein (c-di-GMP phosphodiesterase class II)
MAKTLVEKVASPKPDVTIFRISGTLGYHENDVIARFFTECEKKNITKLVMDFSSLTSLGGGCAKIIRDFAKAGTITVCIAGASSTVQNFLESKGQTHILYETDVQTGIKALGAGTNLSVADAAELADADVDDESIVEMERAGLSESDVEIDDMKATPPPALSRQPGLTPASTVPDGDSGTAPEAAEHAKHEEPDAKELRRKLLQYRALFSLNSDFNRIHEKSRLLDAFLLTTIAQVGVESAAFLERNEGHFTAVAWKGFETADPHALTVRAEDVNADEWLRAPRIHTLAEAPVRSGAAKQLEKWGMPYAAPFVVGGQFRAIVLLGKPIRKDLTHESWEFLSMLINQAAIAYENSCRFEEESDRTLGIVHSLILLIEENTMSRGNTEALVNYVHALAVAMHYPEENIRDLIYGTVLRDIGMIKVSDLILRSPRELVKEEWEIIKRHPIEGADLLRKMKFSDHTIHIVMSHHERFNGEGYPNRLQGPQIPLGARIVSVVESYVAMLQDRPTRPALSEEEALNTLKENWGVRYDPDVVAAFSDIVEEELRTGHKVKVKGLELFAH